MKLENVIKEIEPSNKKAEEDARRRIDSLIKPIGSLGKLEDIAIKISGITGSVQNEFKKKGIVVMCADNGIVAEGVASSPQEITAFQTLNILKGVTGVGVLAKCAGSDLKVVDIGINGDVSDPELIDKKIRKGSGNIAAEIAMEREDAVKAIEVGIDIVVDMVSNGYDLIGTGEMGIGNTSTSSAVAMAFLNCGTEAVGKGAGLLESDFEKKKSVIEKALKLHSPDCSDPLDVLSKVGGLDIAGLAGCFLGAAYCKVPIVIDGAISAAAALTAFKLNPKTRDYMIPSHISKEPAYSLIMSEIGLEPFLELDMRLGEGSGCPMAFQVIDSACAIVRNMATFEEVSLQNDYLVDIR